MAFRAPQPIIRDREPPRGRRQHRNGGRREGSSRRLLASSDWRTEFNQCDALQKPEFRFHARHHAGRLDRVPYRGANPAITDLLAGQVQVFFSTMPACIQHIRAGSLRALAVTTLKRSDALPDVPAVGEFLTGYEASGWYGIGAPKNTPAEIVEKLHKEINAGLAEPKLIAQLGEQGAATFANSPADFGRFIADETVKWGNVIRAANLHAD